MKRSLYIFLAALILAIAALLLQRTTDRSEQAQQRLLAFSESFTELSDLNEQSLNDAIELLSSIDESEWAKAQNWCWEKDRCAILLYENGNLKAWNTSAVPVRFHMDQRSRVLEGAVRLKNGLYLAKTEDLDEDRSVVCLTLIRNEYPIRNQFLTDNWHPKLDGTRGLKLYLFDFSQYGKCPKESNCSLVNCN